MPNDSTPARALALVRRPSDMVETTRWLFAVLALASLLITWPAPLSSAGGIMLLIALACSCLLAGSWVWGYAHRTAPLASDPIDAVAIAGFALACPQPGAVLGIVFGSLWFRSLYGSTGRAVLRTALYVGALLATLPLWQLVPGNTEAANTVALVSAIPTMFVTVIVGRHLAAVLHARERATRRDAVLAAAGTRLLGVTDPDEIRAVAWAAIGVIAAAQDGLRVVRVVHDAGTLRVGGTSGTTLNRDDALPDTVLADLLAVRDDGAEPEHHWTVLDSAAGMRCVWTSMPIADPSDQQTQVWLLLGAPARVPDEVAVSVLAFTTQVALALRSSEVHGRLTVQATLDGLTALANRTSFNTELAEALVDQRADPTSVLFVDLDDFKDVNDAFGHAGGDELLREVAARLVRCTRPRDLCARLGGDEFAVLVRGATSDVVNEMAERIVASVAHPVLLANGTAMVGASVGVATGSTETEPHQLVHQADVAMYAAKAKGKGRIQVFVPGLLQEDASHGGPGQPSAGLMAW